MKIVKRGWIGKTFDHESHITPYPSAKETEFFFSIYDRGKKGHWPEGDWPPRRITVTIEVEDK